MAKQLGMNVSETAYHTRVLADDCECIVLADTKQRRGVIEHFYRIVPNAFIGSPEWRRVPRELLGSITAAALQTFMDQAVRAHAAGTIDARKDTTFMWFPVAVDDRGWMAAADLMASTATSLRQIHADSAERAAGSSANLIPLIVGLAAFEAGPPGKESATE